MTAWSYSSISTFKKCPKQYYHLKVAKDVKDEGGPHLVHGNAVHKAAEKYIKDGTALPTKYGFLQKTMDLINRIKGDKHCEMRLGLTKTDSGFGATYEPCGFLDKKKDVWWRGVADLIIINGSRGFLIDYKTGKNAKYADTKQLDLLAGATFTHFPKVKSLKSALAYVESGDMITKEHTAPLRKSYLTVFDSELERLQVAEDTGVWNTVESPLCAWCPVKQCPHWRERR
jgi:hypothetical protein